MRYVSASPYEWRTTEPGPAEGGCLYTWGGVFTWVEHHRDKTGNVGATPDSNRGCLGLGDTLGRDLPTRRAFECQLRTGCTHDPST